MVWPRWYASMPDRTVGSDLETVSHPRRARTLMRAILRSRVLKVVIAGALLWALYGAADWRKVLGVLANLDMTQLALAVILFVPQTLLSAWRWQVLVRPWQVLRLVDAVTQVLGASALNLVMPSKLGDLSKAAMVVDGYITCSPTDYRKQLLKCAVIEKVLDVAALGALLLVGLVGYGAWQHLLFVAAMVVTWACWSSATRNLAPASQHGQPKSSLLAHSWSVAAWLSLCLWSLHLIQIDRFFAAAGVRLPWQRVLSGVPLAIYAGLAPFTLWGLGTRDAAMVWQFNDLAEAPAIAAVGVLFALRYLVPGACGIVFVPGLFSARHASSENSIVLRALDHP